MRFVILSSCAIPGYGGIRGPVLTPQEYDLHLVLKMISNGIDIREVMDDGEYRSLEFNDTRVMKAIDKGFTAKKEIGAEVPIVNIKEEVKEEAKISEEEELAELEKEIAALEEAEENDEIEIDELEEM